MWFHEVFKTDGTPCDKVEEVEFIREMTGAAHGQKKAQSAGM